MADCYGTLGALAAELKAMHDMRRELQAEIARLQERCARSGIEARRAERDRLRGYFRDALADTGITWPGEVDILYDKCFGQPYVPEDERPNVGAKLPAEAGAVSLVRDDAPSAADQAYSACRRGSA